MTKAISIEQFFENLAIPDSCSLGKRIYKKQFYDNGLLSAADKKSFAEDIEGIEWLYTLKPSTINIPKLEDDTHEYLEVAIIQIRLTSVARAARITQAIQKSIPYPLVIISLNDEQIAINVAQKRINRADSNKIVVESYVDSGFIPLTSPEFWQAEFLNDFTLPHFSYRNFFDFYQSIVARIVALKCAELTGSYILNGTATSGTTERVDALRNIEKLSQEQSEIRNKLKKERNLGTQVQLNSRFKIITDQIDAVKQELLKG